MDYVVNPLYPQRVGKGNEEYGLERTYWKKTEEYFMMQA